MSANDERRLLKRTRNHAEFRSALVEFGLVTDLTIFDEQVKTVTRCWFQLGCEHLEDAKAAESLNRSRSAYSRAYYAAYNASKAVRYHCNGVVSLKGDDHQKVTELPDDFPDVETWTVTLSELYQHRLRSDYDNWTSTTSEHTMTVGETVRLAEQFVAQCHTYINSKFGILL